MVAFWVLQLLQKTKRMEENDKGRANVHCFAYIKVVGLVYARGWEKKRQKSCGKMSTNKDGWGEYLILVFGYLICPLVRCVWYVQNLVIGLKINNRDV